MFHAIPSQNFHSDLQAVNHDAIVVLHRFNDGMLLLMTFDDEMPAFTAGGSANEATTATGYVFRIAEPDEKGTIEFEGKTYGIIEIEDYVVWTDVELVRRKYEEVVGKARRES